MVVASFFKSQFGLFLEKTLYCIDKNENTMKVTKNEPPILFFILLKSYFREFSSILIMVAMFFLKQLFDISIQNYMSHIFLTVFLPCGHY